MCRLLRSSAPPLLVAIDASIEHAGYMTETVAVAVGGTCASVHRGELRCIGTHNDKKYEHLIYSGKFIKMSQSHRATFFMVQ